MTQLFARWWPDAGPHAEVLKGAGAEHQQALKRLFAWIWPLALVLWLVPLGGEWLLATVQLLWRELFVPARRLEIIHAATVWKLWLVPTMLSVLWSVAAFRRIVLAALALRQAGAGKDIEGAQQAARVLDREGKCLAVLCVLFVVCLLALLAYWPSPSNPATRLQPDHWATLTLVVGPLVAPGWFLFRPVQALAGRTPWTLTNCTPGLRGVLRAYPDRAYGTETVLPLYGLDDLYATPRSAGAA